MRLWLVAIVGVCALAAQTPQKFETVSVKPVPGPLGSIDMRTVSGPRLILQGYQFTTLIQDAYGLKSYQLSLGGLANDRTLLDGYFDISAVAPGDRAYTAEEFRPMLQAMLADRFKLVVHHEAQSKDVFNLVVGDKGQGLVGRPVIDKTGLAGAYDFTYVAMPMFLLRRRNDPGDIDPIGAVQTLGLKLVPATAPMDVIVVDHAEMPTPDCFPR